MKDLNKLRELLEQREEIEKRHREEKYIINEQIDKYTEEYREHEELKKNDIIYDRDLNEYKIVAVNKDSYRLNNGDTVSKLGLTNYRGTAGINWDYYYSKEHRDIIELIYKESVKIRIINNFFTNSQD